MTIERITNTTGLHVDFVMPVEDWETLYTLLDTCRKTPHNTQVPSNNYALTYEDAPNLYHFIDELRTALYGPT